jgi:molybdopterin converting factor small subunit
MLTFHIPGPLRTLSGGRSQVQIDGGSSQDVRGALEHLWRVCPGIRDRVVTEEGRVREHVNLFVGNEDVRYTGGLATPITADAEIHIVPAISGGAPEVISVFDSQESLKCLRGRYSIEYTVGCSAKLQKRRIGFGTKHIEFRPARLLRRNH